MNDEQHTSSSESLQPTWSDYPITVLLVDDQAMMGEMVRRLLASESDIGFQFCSSAKSALEIAKNVRPTVILQDLVMPDVEGLALVQQYRGDPQTRDIPVIVLSSREEPATKHDAFLAGANDYVVKLPDALELIARIRYHSRAYINQLQRDQAYELLEESRQQLIAANQELKVLSNNDGLTGVANRRFFDEYLQAEWLRARREKQCLALLMLDVDDFKKYNDTYGHLAGDHVLQSIAEAVRTVCQRPADLVARYGGEEFSVVLPATTLNGAITVGERICRAVGNLAIAHEGSSSGGTVSLSIGAASIIPVDNTPPSTLVKLADDALYEAKRQGKNRVVACNQAAGEPQSDNVC